jgi:flagellar biosynthesis protein FliP
MLFGSGRDGLCCGLGWVPMARCDRSWWHHSATSASRGTVRQSSGWQTGTMTGRGWSRLLCFVVAVLLPLAAGAQDVTSGDLASNPNPGTSFASAFGLADAQLLRTGLLVSFMAVFPTIFVCMTAFVRISIVLAMVRHAFAMPETPPNTVLVSLAVILTVFVMGPTFSLINERALLPLLEGRIDVEQALSQGAAPLRSFMLKHVRDSDLALMYGLSKTPVPATPADVDLFRLAPAFVINELRVAFTIGFVILLPFMLIDLVVASILLALGMMMVPPATISLPIKVLMFVLIDGWALVIQGVVGGFG